MLGKLFEVEGIGAFDLKGFDQTISLVRVVREQRAESRFRAIFGESGENIVGREHELGILKQTWERARSGIGETMLLVGEAGIGKSRLLEEFLAKCVEHRTTDVVRLNCSPYFNRSAFLPVIDRISQDAKLQPDDDEGAVVKKVRSLLVARQNFDVETSLPVYAALVSPSAPEAKDVTSLPPQEQRDLTTQVLVDAIRARASVRPVLLVVEDAHWLDPSTTQLLDRFVATCSDIPLMVLVTHRPEWSSGWSENYSNISTINLRRFDRDQVAKLINQMTGNHPEEDLLENILERTDGVPLFVEEVARVIFTSGREASSSVPPTLQGALMARLDAVTDKAKQAALTASVIGREFDLALVRAATGQTTAETHDCLEELQRQGLVFESGVRRGLFVFRHALIRDTAYQSMLSSTRRAQHAAVASALMTLRPAEVERSPELVARHLTEAGDYAAAFDRWRLATERSLARSASAEAVSHAEETVRMAKALGEGLTTEKIVAQTLLGRSYESIGRLQEALKILYRSAQEARSISDFKLFADAAYYYSEANLMANDSIEIASALCLEAMKVLPAEEEFLRCRIMSQLSRCMILEGKFTESSVFSRQAIELAGKLGDDKAKFSVMMARFMAPLIAKEKEEVQEWRSRLNEMQEVAERLGDTDRGRNFTINLFISAEMGDRERVERSLNELLVIGKERKHPQLHWVERHGRAMLAILDGDFDRAEALSKDAFAIGKTTHGPQVEGVYSVQMFTIRREQARLHEVAPVMKRLLDDNPEDQAWKPGFALIAAELGYLEAAQRILTEMSEAGFDLPLDAMYSTTLAYLAEVAVAVGDAKVAEEIYSLLLPYEDCTITAGVTTVCNGAAGRMLGSVAAFLGDLDVARRHFDRALELDSAMRAKPWIAHTKAEFARALRMRGRKEDVATADQMEGEALEISRQLGMISLASNIEGKRN
nr:AAA family ATPase [Ruegeria marisrubri]